MSSPAEIKVSHPSNLRFDFGKNWSCFLNLIDENRIEAAEKSLKRMIESESLQNKTFLDIGCGSGLFSLAARRLQALVYSFDNDSQSVACTAELRRQYFPQDGAWTVHEGSVLDFNYLQSLGKFDVVFSWGVLHHTGSMWQAFEHACSLVSDQGKLCLAIYNDQGWTSRMWLAVKWTYNLLPQTMRWLVLWPAFVRLWVPTMLRDLLSGRPCKTWVQYKNDRGMSPWHDVVDWVGGYPFEVAKPAAVIAFFSQRGFDLHQMKTCGNGHACNEFVFINKSHIGEQRFRDALLHSASLP